MIVSYLNGNEESITDVLYFINIITSAGALQFAVLPFSLN
jgi:hypothetical protein